MVTVLGMKMRASLGETIMNSVQSVIEIESSAGHTGACVLQESGHQA